MGGEVGWEEVRKVIRDKYSGIINKRKATSALFLPGLHPALK